MRALHQCNECHWDRAGIDRLNGTQLHLRIDYSCDGKRREARSLKSRPQRRQQGSDGLCVRFGECEAKLVCATEHEMGAGVGNVRPADGWCTAEELAA